jgi:type IV pilus assembly protein PilM
VQFLSRGAVETPAGSLSGTEILEPQRMAQAVRSLWRRLGLTTRSVSVALLPSGYTLRTMRLPEAPERERHALVRGELEQLSALPYGGGGFGCLWMTSPAPGVSHQADVAAYYAGDTLIDSVRQTLSLAGLRLESMEPSSIAMMRAYLATRSPRQPVALLCPAERYTDLCVHDGHQVRHVRRIPTGWQDAVQAVGPEMGNPLFVEAPAPPLNLSDVPPLAGWPADESEPGFEEGKTAPQSSSRTSFLVSEVARSLAFYAREHEDEARPQELVLLGPDRVIRDLQGLLSQIETLPVVAADPLPALDLPRPADSPNGEALPEEYLAAVGVALGGAGVDAGIPRVDVSQQEAAATTRRRAPRVLLAGMAGSTIWLCLSAAAAIGLTLLESRAIEENGRLTQEIATIKAERAPLLQAAARAQAAQALQAKAQIPALSVLGRIAVATPPGVALTNLQLSPDGKTALDGQTLSLNQVQILALLAGQGRPLQSPIIEKVAQDNNGIVTFHIDARFKEPAPPPPAPDSKEAGKDAAKGPG